MLELFHYDRSTAAQRVRLALEEKGLPWKSHVVDTALGDSSQRPDSYHELNPRGLVPVLIHEGRAISESLVILEYLEDAFPESPLRPPDPYQRAQMRLWTRRIEEGIHVASRIIGVCIVNRHSYLAMEPAKLKKYYDEMRDTVRKRNDLINIEHGLESPLLPDAVQRFRRLFSDMDAALQRTQWLAGNSYSLADIALVVYVRRLESFQMSPLWAGLNHLNAWYASICARLAYEAAILKWGDVTSEARIRHGQDAFPTVRALWDAGPQ